MDTIVILVVLVFVASIVAGFLRPQCCSICNNPFKRKYYTWNIGGKKHYLCPGCSSRMDRKVSKERFNQKFGK